MKNSQNQYKGFDWTELCITFNVPLEQYDPDLSLMIKALYDEHYRDSYFLKCFLQDVRNNSITRELDDRRPFVLEFVSNEIRKYLEKFVIETYLPSEAVFWDSLRKIEEDRLMIEIFMDLIDRAWT